MMLIKFLSGWKLILSAVFMLLASGCGSLIMMSVGTAIPTSKYRPMFVSDKNVDDYYLLAKSVSGDVVSDQLGSYFHQVRDGVVDSVFFSKEDEGALRNLLSGDAGLLEPMYTYNEKGQPVLDWPATQRRHTFLIKEVNLRLLPLTETKKYHELLSDFSRSQAKRHSGAFALTASAFSGNFTLYNDAYAQEVLSHIRGDFNYVITDVMASAYFSSINVQDMGSAQPVNTFSLNSALLTLRSSNAVEFVPVKYFETLKKGGAFRGRSGCHSLNVSATKELIARSNPSFLSSFKGNDPYGDVAGISIAKKALIQQVLVQDGIRSDAERACKLGLNKMQISGVIQSKKLE